MHEFLLGYLPYIEITCFSNIPSTLHVAVMFFALSGSVVDSLCVKALLLLITVCSLNVYYRCKGKGSPYSVAERRVLELIPVLGSQPVGDASHKPGSGHYFPPGPQ